MKKKEEPLGPEGPGDKTEWKPTPLPHYDTTRAVAEDFEIYFTKHVEKIKTVQAFMEVKLSSYPEILVDQISEAERHGTWAVSVLAFANSYLDLAERQRLVPADKKSYTDIDRSVELAAACARERRFRDVCGGLVDWLERRVSLGQSLLKYHETRLRNGA